MPGECWNTLEDMPEYHSNKNNLKNTIFKMNYKKSQMNLINPKILITNHPFVNMTPKMHILLVQFFVNLS